jgi:hypothetical protein
MQISKMMVVTLLLLAVPACNRNNETTAGVHVQEPEAASVDKDVQSQNRINGFLYAALVPKLQSCWASIKGKGEISFKYTYKRDGSNWLWQEEEVESSTLPTDQSAAAQKCMQDAASGSSFPMEASEAVRKSDTFHLHWSWPVPFPPDVRTMALMISTNPGGGSGECPKSCVDCVCKGGPGPSKCSCTTSCSGYTGPCTEDSDGSGCRMFFPKCSTGRIGFFGGGLVIARANPDGL